MVKIHKSSKDRALLGVCGGIAEYFGVSSFLVRLIFFVIPLSLLIYLILAVVLPEDRYDLRYKKRLE